MILKKDYRKKPSKIVNNLKNITFYPANRFKTAVNSNQIVAHSQDKERPQLTRGLRPAVEVRQHCAFRLTLV